ncbi:MAG: hypothetical protein KDK71_03375 [Chlamydiia bacterium]|nr:hypothetical protein [Chlamydiia bacterium]
MKKKCLFLLLFIFSLNLFGTQHEEITPPVGPYVKGGINVFVTGEFLWWKGMQEGLSYASSGVLIQSGTTTSSGRVHKIDPSWNPGFRIGIGFYPGHDGWDLYGRYTWYHGDGADQATRLDGNMLPIGTVYDSLSSVTVQSITHAKSHWDLHYNVVDLELGRNFFLSNYLKTRLFAGLRGVWNSQDWKTYYTSNQLAINGGAATFGTIVTDQDQDTWGLGIRMGGQGTWTFYKGYSIVADASFAGIWIDYDNHRKDSAYQPSTLTRLQSTIKSDPNSNLFNLDLMLGLRGEWWLYDDTYHLSIQGGWENQIWLHYGNFIFLNRNNRGDLTFSGFSAKLRFDF